MPRTAPSDADLALMALASASGLSVTASQLERWRSRGLIPKPVIQRQGRGGSRAVYPPGTDDLVCALARHAGAGRSYDDLVLLAFFSGASVLELPLKAAIARAYFTRRIRHEDQVARVAADVPSDWACELDSDYEQAEAEARIVLEENGRAVHQMRINLRRLPDLAHASRDQVDSRLLGVLVGLEREELPTGDRAFMSDLEAALYLECEVVEDCLAVWEHAAICHVAQMGRREVTSPRERADKLARASLEELASLREEVRASLDQMWHRATWGSQERAPMLEPWLARRAAGMLMEWMSAREAHPPGSVLADRYFIESLADLELRCLVSRLHARTTDMPGEGRAAFCKRTGSPY
ncbi:hypothetical protein ACFU6S_02035 [Streptomyces sp. NPDC057456]|uniref:hypothetical protein n=1 Tax=Streptomyces sp. NPDC057456 TaxID=3346139 RepID=UPI0036783B02